MTERKPNAEESKQIRIMKECVEDAETVLKTIFSRDTPRQEAISKLAAEFFKERYRHR